MGGWVGAGSNSKSSGSSSANSDYSIWKVGNTAEATHNNRCVPSLFNPSPPFLPPALLRCLPALPALPALQPGGQEDL